MEARKEVNVQRLQSPRFFPTLAMAFVVAVLAGFLTPCFADNAPAADPAARRRQADAARRSQAYR